MNYYIIHTGKWNADLTYIRNGWTSLSEARAYADEHQATDARSGAYRVMEDHGFYMEDRVAYVSGAAQPAPTASTSATTNKPSGKVTREEMIEKLNSIKVGSKMVWQGKTYAVLFVKDCGGKLNRRDMCILEEGKPEYTMIEGKYLAAGKMIQQDNSIYRSLMAQKSHMDFEVIG